jgi:hypothetical protein
MAMEMISSHVHGPKLLLSIHRIIIETLHRLLLIVQMVMLY